MRENLFLRINQYVPPSITWSTIGFVLAFFATGLAQAPSGFVILFGLSAVASGSVWILQKFVFVEIDDKLFQISTLTTKTRIWKYEIKSVKRLLCTLHETNEHTKIQFSWRPYQVEIIAVELDRPAKARSVPKVLDHLLFDFDAIFKAPVDEEIEAYYFHLAEKLENFVLISTHVLPDSADAEKRISYIPENLPGQQYIEKLKFSLGNKVKDKPEDLRLHHFWKDYMHKKLKDEPAIIRREWQKK